MKRLFAAVLIALAMAGAGAALAPAASAHSELVSSDPVDGAVLDAPPTAVSFTFSEDLLPDFVRLITTSPSGETSDLIVSSVQGPTVTADWPLGAPGGEWTVSYRVVSQDGHPIEGGITFGYVAPEPPSPSPSPTSASPTSAAPITPSPSATSAIPSPTTSPAADTTSSGPSAWMIAGIAVVVIAGIAVAAALIVRRRA